MPRLSRQTPKGHVWPFYQWQILICNMFLHIAHLTSCFFIVSFRTGKKGDNYSIYPLHSSHNLYDRIFELSGSLRLVSLTQLSLWPKPGPCQEWSQCGDTKHHSKNTRFTQAFRVNTIWSRQLNMAYMAILHPTLCWRHHKETKARVWLRLLSNEATQTLLLNCPVDQVDTTNSDCNRIWATTR